MDGINVVVVPSAVLSALHRFQVPAQEVPQKAVSREKRPPLLYSSHAIRGMFLIASRRTLGGNTLSSSEVPNLHNAIRTAAHDRSASLQNFKAPHPAIVPSKRCLAFLGSQRPHLDSCIVAPTEKQVLFWREPYTPNWPSMAIEMLGPLRTSNIASLTLPMMLLRHCMGRPSKDVTNGRP